MKTKIYGFNNGGSPGWYQAMALSEHGDGVAQHCCSHEDFMPHDLGMDGKSNWKHDHYNKMFPDGWETEFVPSKKIDSHEGLQKAFALAREKPPVIPAGQESAVTITVSDENGKETEIRKTF